MRMILASSTLNIIIDMDIELHDDRHCFYPDWVRLKREEKRLPLVIGHGAPARLILNYGRWMWQCGCFEAHLLPREGPVACTSCEVESWHPVDWERIREIETEMQGMPRREMHWED